jgi:hypothetical protein
MEKSLSDMTPEELIAISNRALEELHNRDRCEHGILAGMWCSDCNTDYKVARRDPENGIMEEE